MQPYNKLGKRIGLTIQQLGHPTKNALRTWCCEYERLQNLPPGYVRRPRYSQADKHRYSSYMGEISPARDNVLNRDFSASAPNEKWLIDITELQTPAGKVYLSRMLDCFDGMVVSWSIGTRPNAVLVNTMLDAAIDKIAASGSRPVVHSDRGGHHRWPGWLSRNADAKLVRSMSRKGHSPDNAACEGLFGHLKIEMFVSREWLHTTMDEFIASLGAYIRWHNEARIKVSLGVRSPIKHRSSTGIAVWPVQVFCRPPKASWSDMLDWVAQGISAMKHRSKIKK